MNFEYTAITEKNINKGDVLVESKTVISIITPFYNAKQYLEDTAKCIINQTFPYFEWIIIDDGSSDSASLEYLSKIQKMDSRIRVFHKENSGQSDSRDFGVKNSSSESKYVLFIDDDDIIDDTYLECAYWTLETNKGASWAFTDVIHFGEQNTISTTRFSPEREKKENNIVVTALIRKDDFLKVGGFGLKEKDIYEDWNLWLKMIAAKMYPVRMNFFGFWYRRKKSEYSELSKSQDNKDRAKKIIDQTVKTIGETHEAIQYPRGDYNWDLIDEKVDSIIVPKYKKNNKTRILMIIPWMVMGGADKFNIDLINGLDKDKFEVTVISTEPNLNVWRQEYQFNTKAIYDLTTFLDRRYWIAFINYIIEKNNINIVFNTNSVFGYSVLPYIKAKHSEIPIIDYIHMEEWYNRNGGFSRDCAAVSSVIDKTLVCNENSRKILINHFGKDEHEVETVYIGVDEKKFNPDMKNIKELKVKYGVPLDKKVVSFIARIDLQKRPYLLIQIIKATLKRKDVFFVVAGDGPMLSEIKELAKKEKINDSISFLGSVSNTKEIYAISDITLNCSIKEGLALTAYESLSMGVPVISADVGGQAELINEKVGVIIPCLQNEADVKNFKYSMREVEGYVDGIDKILNNLETYKRECRPRVLSGFTIDYMIKRMSSIMQDIAENPNYQKIENGRGLTNCIDICKELNTKYLVAHTSEYEWQVQSTNIMLDKEVDRVYRENCGQFKKKSKIGIIRYIQEQGKKTFIVKVCQKLHIYNEAKIVFEILSSVGAIFVNTFKYIKTELLLLSRIIKGMLKLVLCLFIRIINIFLKLFGRKSISIFDKKG